MSRGWEIVTRKDSAPLVSANVTRSISSYVPVSVKEFRIYGVYGEEPTPVDGAESVLLGGAVIFYLEFNNPDDLNITYLSIDSDSSWYRNTLSSEDGVWWNQIAQYGKGYLWQLATGYDTYLKSPITPSLTVWYDDPDGGVQYVGPTVCSNGPLTIHPLPTLDFLPSGWKWVGDTITAVAIPSDLVYTLDVTDWGDQ